MTAPALNAANPAAAALAGAKPPGAAAAAAGNPLAGFEALLASLFPQADPAAALTTAPATSATPASPTAADLLVGDADKDGKAAAGEVADASAVTTDAAVDANAALAAALAGATAAAVEATPTTTAAPDPAEAARAPAVAGAVFPPVLRANLPATALGKGEPAPEAGANDAAADDELATLGTPRPAAAPAAATDAKPAPPAWGRDKAPAQPAAPALANAAPAASPAEVADAAPPKAPATAAPAPSEAPAPVVTAAAAARPEPVAGPAKPAKAERGKASPDSPAAGDVTGPAPIDTPATARAVTAAAKPAAATIDAKAPDVETASAEPAADQPEFTPTAETRAANSSSAPIQHGAQAVRGSPETVANLSAQIIKKLEGQSTRFDVELDPHGLGKVNVRIDIGVHGAITAAMSFDNPQAAAELRARAAELQRALEQAGFNLSGGVTFDVAQDRGQQGQAWQDQTDNNSGRAFRGQAFQAALDTAGDAANAALGGALRLRRGVTAGLDMRI